ncbi:hypothetical protein HPULCUR_001890 [Helicostylum pulchrum]|uniref:DOC domain-containing protein n=1 Tax=Helicostylum pulchrum TaxID=562976 RepID=A0ABP9XQ24_9FUNG
MERIQWVYANDERAQDQIERLWVTGANTGTVYSVTFSSNVSIDFLQMILKFNDDLIYTIARLTL